METKQEDNWFAYSPVNNETETFKTEQDAKDWLLKEIEDARDDNDSLYPEEFLQGQAFVGKITHRSFYNVTDRQDNYDCVEADCEDCTLDPDTCGKEPWPYDHEWTEVGTIELKEINDGKD